MTIEVDSNGVAKVQITPAEFKAEWVHALKYGGLSQTQGELHAVVDGPDGDESSYCCLGVACDLAFKYGIVTRTRFANSYEYGAERGTAVLPIEVVQFLGDIDTAPEVMVPGPEIDDEWNPEYDGDETSMNLAELNDDCGFGFERLGELIDAQVEVK